MEMISNKLIPVLMGFLGTIVGVIFLLLTVGALDSYGRFFEYHCFSKQEGTTAILHGFQDPSESGPGILATLGAGDRRKWCHAVQNHHRRRRGRD